jgi:hypothetical protein
MQDQTVAEVERFGLRNSTVSILDQGIAGYTPALVTHDSTTVFARGLSVVLIAVMPTGCGIGEHFGTSSLDLEQIPRSHPNSSAELHQTGAYCESKRNPYFASHLSV